MTVLFLQVYMIDFMQAVLFTGIGIGLPCVPAIEENA